MKYNLSKFIISEFYEIIVFYELFLIDLNLKMYNFNLSIKMDFFSGHQPVFNETPASRY